MTQAEILLYNLKQTMAPCKAKDVLIRLNELLIAEVYKPGALGERVTVFAMRGPADILHLKMKDGPVQEEAVICRPRKMRARWRVFEIETPDTHALDMEVAILKDLCDGAMYDLREALAPAVAVAKDTGGCMAFCPHTLAYATPPFELEGSARRGLITRYGLWLCKPEVDYPMGFIGGESQ